jgi:predicted DNA-binding WGR domain protein
MRRFEFVEGSSAKFWMGDVEGTNFVIVFGRLGTAGQRKEKAFPTEEAARRELDKKIAEKLREGYSEVSADAAGAAPAGAKGADAASPKLELPPRVRVHSATKRAAGAKSATDAKSEASSQASASAIQAAASALAELNAAVGRRSWDLGRKTRKARRALRAVAGLDPASSDAIAPVFRSLMSRVVAGSAKERLPLVRAMELLYELDAAAFERALTETWKDAPAGSPAHKALTVLAKQLNELEDPEIALRFGALLVDRPDRGSMSGEAGWTQRWKALAPHLEKYLAGKGSTLKAHLKAIDTAGDASLARRVSRMLAA